MTRKSSKQLKFIAFIMSLVMLMTVAPLSAFAENGVIDTSEAIDQVLSGDEIISDVESAAVDNVVTLTAADVPEFIAMSDLTTRGTIRRVYEEEADLSTILFENNDGTRTLYMYGVPVKYVAPDGTTRDKSTAISSLSGLQALWNGTTLTPGQMTTLAQNASIGRLELGQAAEALSLMNTRLIATYGATLKLSDMAYASLDSDIRSLYPTAVSDGVVLNYGDYSIRTIPVATGSLVLPGAANVAESTSLTDNDIRTRVRYSNAFGLGTILQYTPTTMGVKEEIILTSNVGKNSFLFRIETGGLTIEEENGNYYFFDPATQRVIAQLGEIIAYDSNGQIARGAVTVQSVIAGQRYNVTISVSPEFLANAAYPVSVDPTATIYESNYYGDLIEDNAVYSGAGAWGYTFDSFHYVGAVSSTPANESYAGQALYRFPGLYSANLFTDYCNLPSTSINSFVLHLKTGQVDSGTTLYVNPYIPVWQSSPRICDASYYNYLDTSRYNIPIPNVPNAGNVSVDITDIACEWADIYHNVSDYTMASWPSGIVIRNADPTKVCILTAIEQSSEIYATLDYSHGGGTYYLNSAATGKFLGGATSSAGSYLVPQVGLIDDYIESDITWTFQYVGNSQFYIQPSTNPSLYIGSNGKLTSTAFAWSVTDAVSGNGINIYRISNTTGAIIYLGVDASGNIATSSNITGDQIRWRKILPSSYNELDTFTIPTIEMLVGDNVVPTIIASPANATWVSPIDFEYVDYDEQILRFDNITGGFVALTSGVQIITVRHKVTGYTGKMVVWVHSLDDVKSIRTTRDVTDTYTLCISELYNGEKYFYQMRDDGDTSDIIPLSEHNINLMHDLYDAYDAFVRGETSHGPDTSLGYCVYLAKNKLDIYMQDQLYQVPIGSDEYYGLWIRFSLVEEEYRNAIMLQLEGINLVLLCFDIAHQGYILAHNISLLPQAQQYHSAAQYISGINAIDTYSNITDVQAISVGITDIDNYPAKRPTWRQSEIYAAATRFREPDGYLANASFKLSATGELIRANWGESGSHRPDFYNPLTNHCVDIKNYTVTTATGRNNLIYNVVHQYQQRVEIFPSVTNFEVVVDVRGQDWTDDILNEIISRITTATDGKMTVSFFK